MNSKAVVRSTAGDSATIQTGLNGALRLKLVREKEKQ